MAYIQLLPGYQLIDNAEVDAVATQINAALVAASLPSLQLPMLPVGYRMVDGAYFAAMAAALTALGDVGFPTKYDVGYRLQDGSWLNAMEAAVLGSGGPAAPYVITVPSLSNYRPVVGSSITATAGSYAGSPTPTLSRQWYYNDTGAAISGATGLSYTPVSGDAQHTLRYTETATNTSGSASSSAPITSAVAVAPSVVSAPSLSTSSPVVGTAVTATPGSYAGSPSPTITSQWFYGDTGSPISGATTTSYTPVSGDVGHTLKYIETASNTAGSVASAAPTTGAVSGAPATPKVSPFIAGLGLAYAGAF